MPITNGEHISSIQKMFYSREGRGRGHREELRVEGKPGQDSTARAGNLHVEPGASCKSRN